MALVYNGFTGQYEDDGLGSYTGYPIVGFSPEDIQKLNLAKQGAENTNSVDYLKILDGVLKYGGGFLDVLTRNGIIKNKNLASLTSGQYNQAALAELLAKNGGTLGSPNSIVDRSANTIFGLNQSTLILILAGVLLFSLFKK